MDVFSDIVCGLQTDDDRKWKAECSRWIGHFMKEMKRNARRACYDGARLSTFEDRMADQQALLVMMASRIRKGDYPWGNDVNPRAYVCICLEGACKDSWIKDDFESDKNARFIWECAAEDRHVPAMKRLDDDEAKDACHYHEGFDEVDVMDAIEHASDKRQRELVHYLACGWTVADMVLRYRIVASTIYRWLEDIESHYDGPREVRTTKDHGEMSPVQRRMLSLLAKHTRLGSPDVVEAVADEMGVYPWFVERFCRRLGWTGERRAA